MGQGGKFLASSGWRECLLCGPSSLYGQALFGRCCAYSVARRGAYIISPRHQLGSGLGSVNESTGESNFYTNMPPVARPDAVGPGARQNEFVPFRGSLRPPSLLSKDSLPASVPAHLSREDASQIFEILWLLPGLRLAPPCIFQKSPCIFQIAGRQVRPDCILSQPVLSQWAMSAWQQSEPGRLRSCRSQAFRTWLAHRHRPLRSRSTRSSGQGQTNSGLRQFRVIEGH
jgi:hypothetical protein